MIAFPEVARRSTRPLWAALGITAAVTALELAGSLVSGSLALLADAGHMANDVLGLAIALVAVRVAQRPATARKTFGFYRAEILAAAINAALLFAVAIYVLVEAARRLLEPPTLVAPAMLVVAAIGLVANLASARLLREDARASPAVHGARLEVMADALGSVVTLAAAAVVLLTGWTGADALAAAAIGLFIAPRSWRLLRGSVDVLLEGVPAHLDLDELRAALLTAPHVTDVHDLHVWTIGPGYHALAAHVRVDRADHAPHALAECSRLASERFGIAHTTLQVEGD